MRADPSAPREEVPENIFDEVEVTDGQADGIGNKLTKSLSVHVSV